MNNEQNTYDQNQTQVPPAEPITPGSPVLETPIEEPVIKPRKKPTRAVSILCIIIIVICVGYFLSQQNFIKDRFSAWVFSPSPEVAAIKEKLNLTGEGELIFNASQPTLESREVFNEHCNSHNQEVSVLGCYTDRQIFLYDIRTDELPGVVESTAAHELLHAIWERLSSSEKDTIKTELDQVYLDSYDLLSKDLEVYDSEDWTDELYVRAATQIKKLPDSLEEHYAKYFNDQDAIVAYYDSYITPFRKLEEEMKTLEKELDDLNVEISAKTSEYESRANSLSAAVDEFNNCANTLNCFSSQYAFNVRRNELLAEQSALDTLYNEINTKIESYNEKVEKYNNNLLRTQDLENTINSNVDPSEIIN